MAEQTLKEKVKENLDEAFERLERVYQEEVDAYQSQIDAAHERIKALEAKLELETDAKTDAEIRKLAGREQISIQTWMERELKQAVAMADMPYIRVSPEFYDRLWRLAEAKGVMPTTLTTSDNATAQLIALIDNFLL